MADIDMYFLFPDRIRSRFFHKCNQITRSFNCILFGPIFFFLMVAITYIPHPAIRDNMFMLPKVPITFRQAVVIYFIATLNKPISPAGKGGI